MSNMDYCRFRNTLGDLRDCRTALGESGDPARDLSEEELKAAKSLLKLCRLLANDYTDEQTGEVTL